MNLMFYQEKTYRGGVLYLLIPIVDINSFLVCFLKHLSISSTCFLMYFLHIYSSTSVPSNIFCLF